MDRTRIEQAIRQILEAIGEDPDREGLRETPRRVGDLYAEVFAGIEQEPRALLKTFSSDGYDEIVLVRDISFASMCEHHLLPFVGKAHVAYIPNGRVAGISKLARVVECFARRPQIQERMTSQIAETIAVELDAIGTGVVLEASHSCMTIRGVKQPGSRVVTSAMLGAFRENQASRSEVLDLILDRKGTL